MDEKQKEEIKEGIKFAVENNDNGLLTLTIFEKGKAAAIELNKEWALKIAGLLSEPFQ